MISIRIIKKGLLLFLIVFTLFCLTCCANRVEINDRSLVLGAAIDKPQAPKTESGSNNQESGDFSGNRQDEASGDQGQNNGEGFLRVEPPPKDQVPRYAMTIETPIIKELGAGAEGGGGQGGGKKMVTTSTGNTVWDIERALSIRIGRQNFYGHLKAIIISEDVARESIRPVLDFFTRRREVQQNIKLAISNGEARKVLQVTPQEEDYAAFYIDSMLEALFRTEAKINTNMLEIRRDLAESGNAVLPRVRASSTTEIIAGGAAVIKDWKFIGWLSEHEASGYNIVIGGLGGGGITVVDPKNKDCFITVLLRGSQSKTTVRLEKNKPVYTIETVAEWDIVEKSSLTTLWDTDYLHSIENLVALEWQRRGLQVVDKMQREFQADIFGFGSMLSKKYPDYWKSVEAEWDEKYFPKAKVDIKITSKIRRTESKT